MSFQKLSGLVLTGLMIAGLAPGSPARAQTTGAIAGEVLDAADGKPVQGAIVSAESDALQGGQTALTDVQGAFELTLLPAGVYTLSVSRDGYQPFSEGGLKVSLDRTIRVTLRTAPESLRAAPVEVDARRPSTDLRSAQTGGVITSEQMQLVPYGRDARNFEFVATAIPGVHFDQYGLQINGAGSPESGVLIDGVNVANPAFGTQGTTLLQDFIKEVDVKSGGYQAEYGRATGGIINVVTKSGGNEFHGSAFVNWSPLEAERRQVGRLTDALSSQTRQHFNFDIGAELGGPIVKDKLWFFAGFAPQIVSLDVDRIVSKQTDNGGGQAARDQQGNVILTEVDRKTYRDTTTTYQFSTKLTYLIDENHNVALAAFGNPNTRSGLTGPVAANEGGMLIDRVGGGMDVSLKYAGKVLDKAMLIEATAAYHRQVDDRNVSGVDGRTAAQLRDTPQILWFQTHNLNDFSTKGTRTFDPSAPDYQRAGGKVYGECAVQADGFDPCPVSRYLSGGAGFLGNATLDRVSGVLKLTNFVEWAGHHQFKYGLDATKDTYAQVKSFSGGGLYVARPISNGEAPVDTFQLFRGYGHQDPNAPGLPALNNAGANGGIRLAGDSFNSTTQNIDLAAFAQDTWAVGDLFTLDFGVRVERQLMYADAKTLTVLDGPAVQGAQLATTNVMPRLGIIYDPTRRGLSKVYASFGRFYEYIPLDLADRALSGETSVSFRTDANNCKDPTDPRTCKVIAGAASRAGQTYVFTGGAALEPVDPHLGGQYTDEYQVGVQYQVLRDITVGLGYVHKQLGQVVEDMSVDDGATFFISNPGAPGALGQNATTATGLVIAEPKPKRIYDGITLSVNKTFSENWLASASWTYSSLRGNYAGLFRSETGQLDPNVLPEYDLVSLLGNREGPLPGDIPNAFKVDAAYVYELSPKSTLTLGGNVRAAQGGPISFLGAHDLQYGPGAAYILPRGSAGRLPWTWQLDLRAMAQYRLVRDYTVSFTLDLYNVTNNQQATAVDQNYTFNSVLPVINGKPADLAYLRTGDGTPVQKNSNFLQPTAFQLPFSARLGARLSF